MKAAHLIYLLFALTACSTVKDSLPPPDMHVETDSGIEQETFDRARTGVTHPRMRFLLGTTTLEGPYYGNRSDSADDDPAPANAIDKKRRALISEREALARIEADDLPLGNAPDLAKPVEKSVLAAITASVAPSAAPKTALSPAPASAQPSEPPAEKTPADSVAGPLAEPAAPLFALAQARAAGPSAPAISPSPVTPEASDRSLDEASAVPPSLPPLSTLAGTERESTPTAGQATESEVQSVAAKAESIAPPSMPPVPDPAQLLQSVKEHVLAAANAWAQAWRDKDENAYIAAYASSFRPQGGLNQTEWERGRRRVLGRSRNIDLKLDSLSADIESENEALVTFHQFYRSDSYQDAVTKQLKLVLVDGRWLIEEESVVETVKVTSGANSRP